MLKKKFVCKLFMFAAIMLMFWGVILVVNAQTQSRDFLFDAETGTITKYIGVETEVYIPSVINDATVTVIGNSAFSGCGGLTSINIPSSVTSIGDSAFAECSSLCNVNISNSITSIGNCAFSGCSGLTSINIPSSVTSIGNYAFLGCSGLISINIPSSVASIGDSAFSGCSSLTSISIPAGVTSIRSTLFFGNEKLIEINVDATNPKYISEDGILYNKDKTVLIKYPASKIAGNYTIPNSVTSIGNMAFYGCSNITSISIPSSVTNIGDLAFSRCSILASINIPNSVTSIGSCTFCGCSSLTSVIISDGVTSISDNAFADCSSLISISIPNSVTSIDDGAFCGCSSLTSISIPSSVTSIGNYAFFGCSGLTSINIPSSVTNIGDEAFNRCSSLISISIPAGVTSIRSTSFLGNEKLIEINVDAANPEYISEDGILYNKDKTELIKYPAGKIARNYIIPNSITSIDTDAFYGCSSLTSISIPNNVTHISVDAFYECNNLTIFARKGSYAQTYATNNKIPFTALKDTKIVGTVEPDFTYLSSADAKIKEGFKVEVIGQPISVYTDVYGNFAINVSNSIVVCNIKISKPGYLMKEVNNIALNQDLLLSPITMWAGDMNKDNVINMTDIMEVAKRFNSIEGNSRYVADYDFNKDGVINMSDILIVAKHFNTISYMS